MSYSVFIELPRFVTQNNRHGADIAGLRPVEWLKNQVITQLANKYDSYVKQLGNLQGVVYAFQKNGYRMDADNISKPFWDSLNEVLYEDDFQIKLRWAGVVYDDIRNSWSVDTTGLEVEDIDKIASFFLSSTNNYMIYMQLLPLNNHRYKFELR